MFVHETVLLEETVGALHPRAGGRYIDCTVGGGGHTERLLQLTQPDGQVLGLDQDESALNAAKIRLANDLHRLQLIHSNFRQLHTVAERLNFYPVDGILFDLGVSSPQFDDAERGFSYRNDAPLDMRMDRSQKETALQFLQRLDERQIAQILFEYGEERYARRIAKKMVEALVANQLQSTLQLAELVREAIPAAARRTGGHPAKRTFQAIRIALNDELQALQEGLEAAFQLLKVDGRLAVITFHSLEDRMVKQFFQKMSQGCICPPDFPICQCGRQAQAEVVTRKALVPSDEELLRNPRARSAKLRVLRRLQNVSSSTDGSTS
ncbi:16S rRNA (cytosine(1402)-N(4))-methyltransferase RsmH [Alicyclobacillus tolerans]|uniref:Ribosomal RNA small subunit methyltransferase H n=1 Tax=Alicyclobacillus tolerans TaxID=90970 RepID=A0ABT9LVT8_9BACL|nr:16S rRNA (cytosine(1402)-N(4))-methyltransferase RsmH [Alicyclobacillus tengchongensis]MDP9728384.1 16S rRNA (cytosine1402-N4)-methyltransferase [Alicyclobacillus tengchongensis]